MKNKILAVFTALFMILTFAGCNTQGLSLSKELQKAAAWEAISQSGNIDVIVKAGNEDVKVTAAYEAFSNEKDLQMEMTVTPKSIEVAGKKMDLTQGEYKFSPVKMYMDGLKFYLSTSYIKELCSMAGVDASEMMDVSKDYLALDLSDAMKASGVDLKKLTQDSADSYKMYENMKTELPIKQDGRKYTISLTSDQMIDSLFGLVIETFNTQEATLKATYKAMGLSDEEVDQMIAQVKEVYGDQTKEQVKPMIKGSTADITFNFADDSYTTDYKLALKLAMGDEKVDISVAMTDTVKKAAKKTITFPTNVKVYTMQDLEKLMTQEIAAENTVQVAKAQTLVQDGKVYVPVKSTLAGAGLEVQYDEATKSVVVKGTNTTIPTVIKGATSYTTVEFLKTLGVNCEIVG